MPVKTEEKTDAKSQTSAAQPVQSTAPLVLDRAKQAYARFRQDYVPELPEWATLTEAEQQGYVVAVRELAEGREPVSNLDQCVTGKQVAPKTSATKG